MYNGRSGICRFFKTHFYFIVFRIKMAAVEVAVENVEEKNEEIAFPTTSRDDKAT